MKSLRLLSQASGMLNIGIGLILFIKGVEGKGALWAVISGAVMLGAGIMNIISIRLGILEVVERWVNRLMACINRHISKL